jgi:hypothetical protein
MLKGLEIQFTLDHRTGEIEERANLLVAKPYRPVRLRREPRHIPRAGEGVLDVTSRPEPRAAEYGKSVEQFEAHDQRQLLTGEPVDHRFEHRRESRRFHPSESVRKGPQLRISCGHVIPITEIDPKPEEPIDEGPHAPALQRRSQGWRSRHDQRWRAR